MSRMVDETQSGFDVVEESQTIVINALQLRGASNEDQLLDPTIKFIYDLKMKSRDGNIRPVLNEDMLPVNAAVKEV